LIIGHLKEETMAIKITIEGREVKNPFARLVFGLLGMLVFLIMFAVMLFLLVPAVWFAALTGLMFIVGLLIMAPRFIGRYRVIQQTQQDNNKLP